jgi:hypothetical protein
MVFFRNFEGIFEIAKNSPPPPLAVQAKTGNLGTKKGPLKPFFYLNRIINFS